MDTSDEESMIEINLNKSKFKDKTYFVLPKTVEKENEKLIKILTPVDESYKIQSNENDEVDCEHKSIRNNPILSAKIESINEETKFICLRDVMDEENNDNLIEANNLLNSRVSNSPLNDLTQDLSQTSLNERTCKKIKLSGNEQKENETTPKKQKFNDKQYTIQTFNNSDTDSRHLNLSQSSNCEIDNVSEDIIKRKYFKCMKSVQKNDPSDKFTSNQFAEKNGISDQDLISNTSEKGSLDMLVEKNSHYTSTISQERASSIKISDNEVIDKKSILNDEKKMNKVNSIKKPSINIVGTPSNKQIALNTLMNQETPKNQSQKILSKTWDRLDHPEEDETLKYLDYKDTKSSTKKNYGKDGKSLKKSPKIIDLKMAPSYIPGRKEKFENKAMGNKKSSITTQTKQITYSPINLLNGNSGDILRSSFYKQKVKAVFDNELNVLDNEVKIRLVNKIGDLIDSFVKCAVETAFNFATLKVRERISSEKFINHSTQIAKTDKIADEKENQNQIIV